MAVKTKRYDQQKCICAINPVLPQTAIFSIWQFTNKCRILEQAYTLINMITVCCRLIFIYDAKLLFFKRYCLTVKIFQKRHLTAWLPSNLSTALWL